MDAVADPSFLQAASLHHQGRKEPVASVFARLFSDVAVREMRTTIKADLKAGLTRARGRQVPVAAAAAQQ